MNEPRTLALPTRLVALLTGAALIAAGCGGTGGSEAADEAPTTAVETSADDTSVETTSTNPADSTSAEAPTTTSAIESAPVDPPIIEVLDQGAEPRVELRYDIADRVYKARLSQIQSLSQTIDGQLVSEVKDLENLFEVELTSRAVPEGYEFTTLYTDVSMGEGTDPTVAESMMTQLEQLVGSVFLSTIDTKGYILAQAFEAPPGAENAEGLQAFMESVAGQNQFANPLPTEPMGVGGSWKQTQALTLNGIAMVQETIYTITALDGTSVMMDVVAKQIVPAGPIAFPGIPDTVEVSVESWDVTTVGTIHADLTRPFPLSNATVEGAQVLVGTGSQAFRLEQSLTNVAGINPVD